ncbi:BTB/POZ domain-containing protein kctd16 [Dermatophagoides pteronyssinus]|uniref:BTB/POZ domain-containing protein kctd16 n=1 Tax=Dermatophagoides pteronyssinus TaxID=6956 RepID=A0ABQ8JRS7_DERPT|nr:BTB/POZ domain-containing protein kctd16 [Dermatophagoides pteronyssinus]
MSLNTIYLNVGGQKYTTKRETLLFVPESRLASWFRTTTNDNCNKIKSINASSSLPLQLPSSTTTTTSSTSTASSSTSSSSSASSTVTATLSNIDDVISKDCKGRFVIDRDGCLFRHILNYLRNKGMVTLPEHFMEHRLLRIEAEYYGLDDLAKAMISPMPRSPILTNNNGSSHGGYGIVKGTGGPGFITVGYRGSFAFGRDGLADVKFRKLTKILVSGRVALCREIFGDTLNESRDPDHCDDDNRYTARFFLKHLCLEQAFDCLQEAGFHMVGSCGSGTSSTPANEPVKPGIDAEETRWNHYNEFINY